MGVGERVPRDMNFVEEVMSQNMLSEIQKVLIVISGEKKTMLSDFYLLESGSFTFEHFL